MSVVDRPSDAFGGGVSMTEDDGEVQGEGQDRPSDLLADSSSSRASHETATGLIVPNSLDAHVDARAIVRLIQCLQCSLPLRNPLTLPCGNSLCRTCVPTTHIREGVTYPMTAGRQEAFLCPFEDCKRDHCIADCNPDVTLAKILERIAIEVARNRPLTTDTPMLLDERPRWRNKVDNSVSTYVPRSRVLNGGRLLATYTMVELGELRYDSDVSYTPMTATGDNYRQLDANMLEILKEMTHNEMDCQVCYALLHDPLTTPCGHTFCRGCVARILDHSRLCPLCRRVLNMTPGLASERTNKRLNKLLWDLCPDHVASRATMAAEEEAPSEDKSVPLFVLSPAYPAVPVFLHIFEPRYRLMIRRAIEHGDRLFGMVTYNDRGIYQEGLGQAPFMECGTMLRIVNTHLLPDGRSLVETVGVSRFKVKSYGMRDGYTVGTVERFDDVSLADEENIEIRETSVLPQPDDPLGQLNTLPTTELLRICTTFVQRMRARSANWLSMATIAAYGNMPDDPAMFPFWFASVLPIADEEKYRLLPTNSVRERLKITARWVKRIEAQRWSNPSACAIL